MSPVQPWWKCSLCPVQNMHHGATTVSGRGQDVLLLNGPVQNFIEDLHFVYLVLLNYVTRPEETQS